MLPRVTEVLPEPPFRLHLTFSDGSAGVVDLRTEVAGRSGLFEPLADPSYFSRAMLDREAGTVAWPNGLDLDPEVLYHKLTGRPLPHEVAEQTGALR
jgi:hypothetical protein